MELEPPRRSEIHQSHGRIEAASPASLEHKWGAVGQLFIAGDDSFLIIRTRRRKPAVSKVGAMEEWRSFLCRHLGHHRNRSAVQFNSLEQRYESACKRCGIKMVRTPDRQWKLADDAED